ncbi:hypothetical protein K435DRAFT_777598 [Dendrothele bispora CBS 962.96]|uniref:F-box domain-containing protein n=1 Tax=Dendrothele bispora (strain CBS 962.96) TaxID=1314807 RepID=A0A4S8M7C1_DENBC|nr:hypothetical protein K435DRAFT_777598 [Dendrothele bispora CBS 962.96]
MQRLKEIETQIRINDAQLEVVRKKEADLIRLQHQIQQMVSDATAERIELEGERDELEAQKLPINWVPSEILVEIFMFICCYHRDRIPDNFPAIRLSHVSRKWREIALSVSQLWSHIWFPCTGWSQERIMVYMDRSGTTPLDVVFGRGGAALCSTRSRRVGRVLSILEPAYHRCRSIVFECESLDPAYCLTETLNNVSPATFPLLTSLDMAVTGEPFSYASFPFAERDEPQDLPPSSIPPSLVSNLSLERVPLLSLPVHFFVSLKTLEVSYSGVFPNRDASVYASHLLTRLSYTQYLEELTLSNIWIAFDIVAISDQTFVRRSTASSPGVLKIPTLPRLRHLTWSFPPSKQIPQFLSLLSLPNLEKLDLWIDSFRNNASALSFDSQHIFDAARLHYPRLRELSLQCMHPDTLGSALRTIIFPELTKLEIINVERRTQKQAQGEIDIDLPIFPRFETILHEPRLLRLTHLVLSHFSISLDWGPETLGYIPALESLSLEGCNNVGVLMFALTQRVPPIRSIATNTSHSKHRRHMRFCPRLQILSILDCDIDFKGLKEMIEARNKSGFEDIILDSKELPKKATQNALAGRVIKPLPGKGSRLQKPNPWVLDDEESASLAVRMAEMTLDVEPTCISHVRIISCKQISLQKADSLCEFGVDVVWSG